MIFPDYYSYTATFSHDEDGWLVVFPDLERCVTNAASLDEAIMQAHNILEDYMAILERDHMTIPQPTQFEMVETPLGGNKQIIVVNMHKARYRWQSKVVKKSVYLPAWIAELASDEGINLSIFLQKALRRKFKHSVHI